MVPDRPNLVLDDRFMRVVFAVVATGVSFATLVIRTTDAVDWSLLSPTVVVFWLWAAFSKFPRGVLYLLGFGAPLALNIVESDSEVSMFLVIITAAIMASYETNRVLARGLLGLVAVTTFVLGLTSAISDFAWPNWLFGLGFAAGFGSLAFQYSETIDELGHARSLVADQAALQERRRIARDVHDLVGHSLSVVMLHVTGARLLVHKDPHEAERALEQAEVAGRESLAEIRRTVGMLRDEADPEGAALPSPDLTDVAQLVDEYLLGGVAISLDIDGDLARVEGAAALAGYRIVQEALTNASRHAIGGQVTVMIDVGDHSYELVVRNTGGASLQEKSGSGFGLISMRERAKSIGGLLVAGPTPDGWTVEATLPLVPVQVEAR